MSRGIWHVFLFRGVYPGMGKGGGGREVNDLEPYIYIICTTPTEGVRGAGLKGKCSGDSDDMTCFSAVRSYTGVGRFYGL